MTTPHSSLPKLPSNRPCKFSTVYRKEAPSALITEVLLHDDPRMRNVQADRARKREMEKLCTTWHMRTRSRRSCNTWIEYYLWIFCDFYQRQ